MILIVTDTDLSLEGAETPLDMLTREDFPCLTERLAAAADVIVALVPRGQVLLKSPGGYTGPCSIASHFDFIPNPVAGLTALDPDQT
jgi:hypothetical protein